MRILVIAHAHPDLSVGGAEIAAYNLFRALGEQAGRGTVSFLARTDLASVQLGAIVERRPREYLWRQDMGDWFRLRTAVPAALTRGFRDLLLRLGPDIVLVQHFSHIGIEILHEIRRTLPDGLLVLTIHEYMMICHHQGQMVKAVSRQLCHRESPQDCHRCFPDHSPERFWTRKHFIQTHLEAVDRFVSPSRFLRERFIDWGLDPDRFEVIENGQPLAERAPFRRARADGAFVQRIGFFGQLTPYKGIEVLLMALGHLDPATRGKLLIEIHGANLDQQPPDFRDRVGEMLNGLSRAGIVRFAGPYDRVELVPKMSQVDWVIVPSTWWENSPMVIQEAFACGRPVICSGVGGMAEKVRDGVDGLHFDVGNPFDLAEILARIAADPTLRERLARNIVEPAGYDEIAGQYLALCRTALQTDRGAIHGTR